MLKKIIAVACVVAFALTVVKGIAWDQLGFGSDPDSSSGTATVQIDPAPPEAPEVTEIEKGDTVWYYFYNSELQDNGTTEDDFNFGPSPIQKELTVRDYDQIFRETVRADPAIGVANLAWFDAKVGTRYLGEFYESCKQDWAKTMNEAKLKFMADQDLYNKTLDAWFAYLDSAAVEVTVFHATSGIVDQMYMNPFTTDGVPDIVVLETLQSTGDFLKYKLQIKGSSSTTDGNGNAKEISFMTRIDCRFQPSNVAQVMKITPQANPAKVTPTSTPSKTTTPSKNPVNPSKNPVNPSKNPVSPVKPVTPVNPTPKPKPTPTPTPTPSYNKDKNKGTQGDVVKPNDDPGPGSNTNNGVGATKSTKEQPTNTGNGKTTYSDYKSDMSDLAKTNKTQKTGNDDNTPSYTPPSTTVTTKDSSGKSTTTTTKPAVVDNNGDKGNGGAPVNNPTPVTKPSTSAETGKPISNDSSNPAGAWGGPPD